MKIKDIQIEAYSIGELPPIDEPAYNNEMQRLLKNAKKIKDVTNDTSIYQQGTKYLLVKNNNEVVGHIDLSPINIRNTDYLEVKGIYILPEYRKTTASSWLLYGVKELVNLPVVADGAIFKDGSSLIKAIQKNKIFRVSALNTKTGERSNLTGEINDPNLCYLFDATNLGFTKTILEGIDPVWLPLFDSF